MSMLLVDAPAMSRIEIGDRSRMPVLFAGPCVIESEEHLLRHARSLKKLADAAGFPLVFKSSYDKANRTSGSSFRGLGMAEGLRILSNVRGEVKIPVITDVHNLQDVDAVASAVDILQIPAFLCRQTDLICAAAETGKPLLIKKGQFVAPEDMRFVVEKAESVGNSRVMLCERGSCFGYRDLVVDFRSLAIMNEFAPVVFDATHSVQRMGGAGGSSSGDRRFVAPLARAAVAFGCDGLFIECHENPEQAPSDGPNMLPLAAMPELLERLAYFRKG